MELEMDYAEMLYAAEVRKLANDLWREARVSFSGQIANDMQRHRMLAEWDEQNRLEKYVAQAHQVLSSVAAQLRDIGEQEKRGASARMSAALSAF
jgi:enamine deaminase RidA (YjgF/YER057c/UK114 family)